MHETVQVMGLGLLVASAAVLLVSLVSLILCERGMRADARRWRAERLAASAAWEDQVRALVRRGLEREDTPESIKSALVGLAGVMIADIRQRTARDLEEVQ